MASTEENSYFILVVSSKEEKCANDSIMTQEGEKFLVLNEPEGWVPATSCHWDGEIPKDAKTFSSIKLAEKFAKKWKGHPWWCNPNGNFEVIPVEPLYETKQVGWKRVTTV